MKILFISTTYPTPTRPRQGAFNRVLVQALRHSNEVQVVAPIPWTQWHEPGRSVALDEHALHPCYYYSPKILRAHYGSMYWQSIRRTILKLERNFKPDIVLGYFLHPDGWAANMAARYLRVPSVLMSGGTDVRLLTQAPSRKAKIQQTLSQTERLIVVSRELMERAEDLGMQKEKIDVVYRGIDRNCFQPQSRADARAKLKIAEQAVVVLWVGRFEAVKNPGLLLEAAIGWKQLWKQHLRIKLIGDGSLRRELLVRARQLGLEDVLEILPSMNQSQLSLYYNAANVTALTSRSEGIPNVLLESIACDTPFVATNVGGVSEIASPNIDCLVPSEDSNSLCAAVVASIERTATAEQSGMQPREFFPYDNWSMGAAVERVLQSAIRSHDSRFITQAADAA